MHLAPLVRDLAIILGVAGIMSLLFRRIRQPVVLGYIIAGIIVGPHTPPFQLVTDVPSIQTWAELGVIFLMFTLGLEFSFRKLARVGGSAGVTASSEVLFFLPFGFVIGKAFGWSSMDSVFLGAMLSISSTTIIIKALDELKLKKHRFAELIFATLIVEDLFAILLLVALGTIAGGQAGPGLELLLAAFKLAFVVGGWFIIGYFIVPRFMKYVGRIGDDEMLTILSLGLCLALVVFANQFGYSAALGAFIMGSIIAESPVLSRIELNMASLRDLFGAIFFVSIGMLIDPRILWTYKGTIGILCVATIFGKILSTGFGALISGQSLRNSIRVGFGLAQIGEFSFIIAQLGLSLKVMSPFLYPVIVAVSLVTTFTTPYFIRVSGPVASTIEGWLPANVMAILNRYAANAELRRAGTTGKESPLRPLLRWSINGLITALIFVACSEWLLPILQEKAVFKGRIIPFVGWLAAIVSSSPFIWAMMTAYRKKALEDSGSRTAFSILRVLSKGLALIWVGALSAEFFPGKYIVFVSTGVLVGAFILFYRRLESSYHWFESRFLSTFEGHRARPSEVSPEVPFGHLAPWDAHLVTMEIHPNSKLVMKPISESAIRARFGVNIVAIQRGRKSIVTPMPHEALLPRDQLILLGTDEQVEKVRMELETPGESAEEAGAAQTYELRQARLSVNSPLVGQTIRQSKIREKYHAMVVGIERGGTRNINPDSDLKLLENDILWIAGETAKLGDLTTAVSPNA